MKKLMLSFAGMLAFSIAVLAKCGPGGVDIITEQLPVNGALLLDFYGGASGIADQVGKDYTVQLQSDGKTITLRPQTIYKGNFMSTQVLFVPSSDLQVGNSYTVIIQGLPRDLAAFQPRKYSSVTNSWQASTVSIVPARNTIIEPAAFKAVQSRQTYAVLGCGPAQFTWYDISGLSNGGLVQVTVTDPGTNVSITYILTVEEGKIAVGNHMCSGPFALQKDKAYTIQFVPLHVNGSQGIAALQLALIAPGEHSSAG